MFNPAFPYSALHLDCYMMNVANVFIAVLYFFDVERYKKIDCIIGQHDALRAHYLNADELGRVPDLHLTIC